MSKTNKKKDIPRDTRIICPICTIEYTYYNQIPHDKSFLHNLIKQFKSEDDFIVCKGIKKENALDYLIKKQKKIQQKMATNRQN